MSGQRIASALKRPQRSISYPISRHFHLLTRQGSSLGAMDTRGSAGRCGIPGLDRRAMEEARLARVARKRGVDAEASGGDVGEGERKAKIARVNGSAGDRAGVVLTAAPRMERRLDVRSISPPARSRGGGMAAVIGDSTTKSTSRKGKGRPISPLSSAPVTSQAGGPSSQPGVQYPDGVIKKTWCFGYERKNDIKLEEVLQKKDLKVAVISSFCWDFDMLATKFNEDAKFILVLQARNDKEREGHEADFSRAPRIRTVYPPMSGNPYACMHSKLMLLFHPTYLRVVVPSANFLPFDWGETGVMENSVFLIDLPRLPENRHGTGNDTLTPFSEELMRFLNAMGMYDDMKEGVLKFDFSKTDKLRFIHTIGGTASGHDIEQTGFPGLGSAVRSLQLQIPRSEALEVDMAASSIGALDHEQLDTLHHALRGLATVQPSAPGRSKRPQKEPSLTQSSTFRILFPSVDTVRASKGGPANGGTLFLRPKCFDRESFPAANVHEYVSKREGLLSHNKLILARSASNAFVYLGSHNLSQAAWGRLTWDTKAKAPKLSATNWECGVLVPVCTNRGGQRRKSPLPEERDEADISTASEDDEADDRVEGGQGRGVLPFEVFGSVFDVPFVWPPKRYEKGQRPWCAGTVE